jgi:hypothetical protein
MDILSLQQGVWVNIGLWHTYVAAYAAFWIVFVLSRYHAGCFSCCLIYNTSVLAELRVWCGDTWHVFANDVRLRDRDFGVLG